MIYFLFNWGDGTTSPWMKQRGFREAIATHTCLFQGAYIVKVIAKDIYGRQSNWSESLPITMPYSYNSYNSMQQFLELLFKRIPYAVSILRQLLDDEDKLSFSFFH